MNLKKTAIISSMYAFLTLSVALGQSVLTNGLVGYYPFDGNANDLSGFGRHGIIAGNISPTSDRAGTPGGALFFDGTNDWIRAASTINGVSNSFTISVWFQTTQPSGINGSGGGGFPNRFEPCVIWPSHGDFTWGDGSAGAGLSASTNLICVWEHTSDYTPQVIQLNGNFTGWIMATVVYSNKVPFLYTNGQLAAVGNPSAATYVRPSNGQTSANGLSQEGGFGGYQQGGGANSWFRGSLDDLRFYNRALPSAEVATLFTSTGSTFCSPHKATATAQLVNGFVVGINLTDPGCGYTNPPTVLIQGGGGSGATATAVVSNGLIVAININNAGCCYTSAPTVVIASPPFVPTVNIKLSRVAVTQNVVIGRNYILESSPDLIVWTPTGPPYTAQSETVTNEFLLNQVAQYFRIREVP